MFTHELLDEYTCSFTTSETPFVAWVSVVSRRYALSGHDFVSNPMLRSVWFSYVRIQRFDNDMHCVQCGPTPDNVIWDGVTLAFGRKHVLESLKPPTTTDDSSPIHENRKYIGNQQILANRQLRDLLRKVIAMPTLPTILKSNSNDNLANIGSRDNALRGEDSAREKVEEEARAKAAAMVLDHIGRIESVAQALLDLDKGLGTIFTACYGVEAYQHQRQPPTWYRQLFKQVCRLIQNHVSVLIL